jgi:hypothetical protein
MTSPNLLFPAILAGFVLLIGILRIFRQRFEHIDPSLASIHIHRSYSSLPVRMAALVILIFIGYSLYSIGSFDKALRGPTSPDPLARSRPDGQNWRVADGIRWFHVLGTDSAGICYSGWVSERSIQPHPPVSTVGVRGNALHQQLARRTIKDRTESINNLGKAQKSEKTP